MLKRRDFMSLGALALAGCATKQLPPAACAKKTKKEFHVFSKMFQAPVTKSVDELCELMAKAGFDGIQWTLRAKGHVMPERVKEDLPRVAASARKQGLKCTTLCTAITDGDKPESETLLKVARDCGFSLYRPGYYFYDSKHESFAQSMERIKRGFASLERLGEKTQMKATYQNHSSWGPEIFGGVVWDIHECVRSLNPDYVAIEYDPMHAYFEMNRSWRHGFELVSPWIGAVDLKDFYFKASKSNPKNHTKHLCKAGEGIVPWQEVKSLIERTNVHAPYILHFEHDFDKTDLLKTVTRELDVFKRIFA